MHLILLVEDSKTQRIHSYQALRACGNLGKNIISADNGIQAIELARLHRPDLILMDISMPKMDGLEACRRLKKDPFTQDIPIIMLSSCNLKASRMRALMRGANGYLTKPIADNNLCPRLSKILESSNNSINDLKYRYIMDLALR